MGGRHYLPNTAADRQAMLAAVGVSSVDELFTDIPANIRFNGGLNLPPGLTEMEVAKLMNHKAAQNKHTDDFPCFLGAGAYDHFVPSVVGHLAGRSEFYTAYTQYQPEISQGGLQALWEYQSFICELTQMDVANASLYDGGTALAEAMNMACGATGRSRVLVSDGTNPFYRRVLNTYASDLGIELVTLPLSNGLTDKSSLENSLDDTVAAVIIQTPNFFGIVEQMTGVAEMIHAKGGLLAAAVNPISLAVLKPPGAYGADIAVGEGQPLGLGLNFGGPYLGFMAVREKLMRRMPGRIVGQTVDQEGNRGFVLTLQAREQHIRREKAYSNICSNQGLCAITAAVYLSAVGKTGLRKIAEMCIQKAHYAAEKIKALPGFQLAYDAVPFFMEFVVRTPRPAAELNQLLQQHGIIGGLDLAGVDPKLADYMLICVTEKRTRAEIDALVSVLGGRQ